MRTLHRIGTLAVILSLVACQAASGGAYADPKGRFSIQPPDGWKAQVDAKGGVKFTPPAGNAQFEISPAEVPPATALSAFASAAEAEIKKATGGATLLKQGDETLDGKPVALREYRIATEGATVRVKLAFIKSGGLILTVAGTSTDAEADKYAPLFSRALASLRVTPAGGPAAPQAADVEGIKKKLAALKAAFDAGIMTEAEYEAKSEALEDQLKAAAGPARPAEPEIDEATRRKLAALKAALDAGILTQAEYDRKRAALLPKAPPPIDPETQRKLAALDAALKAGILTQAEHDAKKAQLLGGRVAEPRKPEDTRELKTFRDAQSGFSCSYPADWTVRRQGELIQFVPPSAGAGAGGATEMYFAGGDNVAARGITRSDDPRLAQLLQTGLVGLTQGRMPNLARVGRTAPVATVSGQGAVLDWQAKNPAGRVIRARAFVVVVRGNALMLLGLGFQELIDKRNADLQRIFASFKLPAGAVLPREED